MSKLETAKAQLEAANIREAAVNLLKAAKGLIDLCETDYLEDIDEDELAEAFGLLQFTRRDMARELDMPKLAPVCCDTCDSPINEDDCLRHRSTKRLRETQGVGKFVHFCDRKCRHAFSLHNKVWFKD